LANGGEAALLALAIDETDVYVTAQYNDASAGGLLRTSLDGGTLVTLAQEPAAAAFVAVDTTNVYWTVFDGVLAMSKDGGAPSTLASGPQNFAGVAADGTSVYWSAANTGTVVRYAIDGGSIETLATLQDQPVGVALDTDSVYWSNLGMTAGAGSIVRVSKAGGTTSTLAAVTPSSAGIAVNGDRVYWTSPPVMVGSIPSYVLAVPIDGGAVSTLATACSLFPPAFEFLVVDPPQIYVTAAVYGGVFSVPIEGGTPIALVPQVAALGITANSENLYWIGDGNIWSHAKP
jgi:hypothetical protein